MYYMLASIGFLNFGTLAKLVIFDQVILCGWAAVLCRAV